MTAKANKSLSVSLPERLHTQLRTEAERRMVSPSLIVARALESFLADLAPIDPALDAGSS